LPPEEIARRAEEEFAQGVRLRNSAEKAGPHFRTAAEYFEELRRRGASNPLLYKNLGNAYLLGGDLPRAILSYRRGLRLAPRDADLRENLKQARALVAYPEESAFARPAEESRPPWLPVLPSRGLFVAALLLYLLAWAALTRWFIRRQRRPLVLAVVAVLTAAALTAALVVNERHSDAGAGALVVIARDEVKLRKGNGAEYPARYPTPVNSGVEARLLFEREGWLQIELSGGEVGWIRRTDAVVDE
jgi:hypothetical protein